MELLTGFVRSAERDGIGELREPSRFRCRVAASKKDISGALACLEMSVNGAANRIRTGDLVLTKDVLYLLSHSSILSFVPISEGFGAPVSAACFSLPRKCSSGLEHSSAPSLATNLPPASLLNASTLLSLCSILNFVPI